MFSETLFNFMFTETRFEFMFSETLFNFMLTGLMSFGNPPKEAYDELLLGNSCQNARFNSTTSVIEKL